MHSPKVPHPDFSVQVVRHNLKIFAVEKFECSGLEGVGVFPFLTAFPEIPHSSQNQLEWGTRSKTGHAVTADYGNGTAAVTWFE